MRSGNNGQSRGQTVRVAPFGGFIRKEGRRPLTNAASLPGHGIRHRLSHPYGIIRRMMAGWTAGFPARRLRGSRRHVKDPGRLAKTSAAVASLALGLRLAAGERVGCRAGEPPRPWRLGQGHGVAGASAYAAAHSGTRCSTAGSVALRAGAGFRGGRYAPV